MKIRSFENRKKEDKTTKAMNNEKKLLKAEKRI